MILLLGQSLTVKQRFACESYRPALTERGSTATMTVGPDAPEIVSGNWIRDDMPPGDGTVWRVKSVEADDATKTRTVQLEHVISVLRDIAIWGDYGPGDIVPHATTVSAEAAARFALGFQEIWTLGDFEFDTLAAYSFSGDSVFEALETITGTLDGAQWEFDLSALPFVLHVRGWDAVHSCEMRRARNISGLKIRTDRGKYYSRIYPVGQNDLHIDGGCIISENESVFGRVDKVETDQSISDKAVLQLWAQGLLKRHEEPVVTVTISGLELSETTGETLDRLGVNRVCRVPLPDSGAVVEARIVKLEWADRVREPERVTVTLSNELADVAGILRQSGRAGSRGARYGAKKDGEDHAWIVDTDEHVSLVAEAVAGTDSSGGPNWSRVAELTVDGHGIDARVTEAEGEIVTLHSEITQTAESIRLEVANEIDSVRSEIVQTADSIRSSVANDLESVRSEIVQTADSIRSSVANDLESVRSEIVQTADSIRTSVANDLESVRSEISVQADRIDLVVTGEGEDAEVNAASIVAKINSTTGEGEVKIDAGHVYIGDAKSTTVIAGKCSLSDVTAEFVASRIAAAGSISCNSLTAMTIYVTTTQHGTASQVATQAYVSGCPYDLQITRTGDTYKLQQKRLGYGSEWTDVGTFSRATTLSAVWSSGKFTVTASPQGDTRQTKIDGVSLNGSASINPGNSKYMNVPLKVEASIDGGESATVYEQGAISLNCTPVWNAGNVSGYITGYNANNTAQVDQQSQTLAYGASVTVKAQYYDYDGTLHDSQSSCTITAPADRYNTGYITGYNANTTAQVNQQTQTLAYGASVTVTAQYYDYDGTLHNSQSSCVITAPADRYSNGWAAAYGCVDLPHNFSTGDHMTVETPPSTVDGTANQTNYYLALDNSYAYIRINSATAGQGVVVARIANTTYAAGWALAYGRVDLPHTFSTSDHITVKTPPSTVGGTATETNYYLSLLDKYAFIRINSATPGEGTAVARVEIPMQEKTVTLTSSQQTIEPDEDYIGLKKVTVPANPHPTQYTLHCTGKDHPSSSAPYTYTFTMTITADAYSVGSNYYFYR